VRRSADSPLGFPLGRPVRLLLGDGLSLVTGPGDHRRQVHEIDREVVDLLGGPPVPLGEPRVFGYVVTDRTSGSWPLEEPVDETLPEMIFSFGPFRTRS
jgi:hypothetical protein